MLKILSRHTIFIASLVHTGFVMLHLESVTWLIISGPGLITVDKVIICYLFDTFCPVGSWRDHFHLPFYLCKPSHRPVFSLPGLIETYCI